MKNNPLKTDGTDFAEETLFILSSKTFTTLETMTNAYTARDCSLTTLKDTAAVAWTIKPVPRKSAQ